jgi:hypothetical protein
VSTRAGGEPWAWPVEVGRYDRAELSALEQASLAGLGADLLRRPGHRGDPDLWRPVGRLLRPLEDTRAALRWQPPPTRHNRHFARDAVGLVLVRCGQLGTAFWQWGPAEWAEVVGTGAQAFTRAWPCRVNEGVRPYALAYAYLLGGFTDFHLAGQFERPALARRAFGRAPVDQATGQVRQVLAGWGHHDEQPWAGLLCHLLLVNRSPYLHELTGEVLERARRDGHLTSQFTGALYRVHWALAELGHLTPPRTPGNTPGRVAIEGCPPGWAAAVERWYATSALTPRVRGYTRILLAKAGRWLAAAHPEITGPEGWTRQTCASWVAAVDRMHVGDHTQRAAATGPRAGEPLKPKTKAGYLQATRAFFRDCQEWEWIPRRFDPAPPWPPPAASRRSPAPTPASSPTTCGPSCCGPG